MFSYSQKHVLQTQMAWNPNFSPNWGGPTAFLVLGRGGSTAFLILQLSFHSLLSIHFGSSKILSGMSDLY